MKKMTFISCLLSIALPSFSSTVAADEFNEQGYFELGRVVRDREIRDFPVSLEQDGFGFEAARNFGNWQIRFDFNELRSSKRQRVIDPLVGIYAFKVSTKLAEAELAYHLPINDWNRLRLGAGFAYRSKRADWELIGLINSSFMERESVHGNLLSLAWQMAPLSGLQVELGVQRRSISPGDAAVTAGLRYDFGGIALGFDVEEGQGNEFATTSLHFTF